MSGALIVEGLLDPFPELRGLPEHVLLLKDAQIGGGQIVHRGIGDDAVRTLNGMLNPTITLRPGETQLWRIGNVGADLYYLLTLDGHRFYDVARDGHRLTHLVPKRQLLLEPGARERSEEHTSELQSPCNLVCRLLLEKKKKKNTHSEVSSRMTH